MTKDEKLTLIASHLNDFFTPDAPVNIQEMIFLAGLGTLGVKSTPLSREDKMAVMHIGICTLMEPFGYYRYTGRDNDGYPQYEVLKTFTPEESESGELLKDAIINYFAHLLKD